ncbi:hypothetical protein EI021_29665, partial [Escherichia coli]|nr:hypothetical protein [Escherichia coli]
MAFISEGNECWTISRETATDLFFPKVAEKVLESFGIRARVKVKSEIPEKSGLGSSSAFLNALICAITKGEIVASDVL